MKRFITRVLLTFSAVVLLSACGSSSSGGGSDPVGGGLATGMFIKTPDFVGGSNDVLPFPDNTTRIQIIYYAYEINGSGYINELKMFHGNGQSADTTCPNMTVKMGHISLFVLGTTFSANVEEGRGSFITVINDANFVIPAGAASAEIPIPLETSFHYNGVDNLVVEFTQNTACTQAVTTDNRSIVSLEVRRVFDLPLDGTPDMAGGFSANPNLIRFVFAGGDNDPFAVGGSIIRVPFTSAPGFQRSQNLYLSSELNGSGPITGVAIEIGELTTAQTYTVSVKLGHATVNTLAADYDANYSGSPATVANAVTFTVPAGVPEGSYVWLPLTESFNYNGTDNLLLELIVSSATGDMVGTQHDEGAGVRQIFGPSNASAIDQVSVILHAKFRFHGGTMDVIINEGVFTTLLFSPGSLGRINLYRASELGTAATINSVACRMATAISTASTFDNYQVIIGHSTVDTLDPISANNFVSQNIAYDGVFNIAAGLVQGDWITVNLSTPFQYNGTSNLVVWMGTTSTSAGAITHDCYTSSEDAARYPGQTGVAVPGAASNSAQDYKVDIRLGISK